MRFAEGILVGMPLLYLCFFSLLLITGTSGYVHVGSGESIVDVFMFGSEDISVTNRDELTDLTFNETMFTEPFPDPDEAGILSSVSFLGEGIGYVKNIVVLELDLLTLPLQNVAGAEKAGDVEAFNMIFWSLFVLPSHILMIFGALFFIRGS